jgi:glycine cleavage system H protein
VNSDPYGAGWMLKIRMSNDSERDTLLGPEEYRGHIG